MKNLKHLKIIKNSHKKNIYNHHNNKNFFVGKIDTKKNKITRCEFKNSLVSLNAYLL